MANSEYEIAASIHSFDRQKRPQASGRSKRDAASEPELLLRTSVYGTWLVVCSICESCLPPALHKSLREGAAAILPDVRSVSRTKTFYFRAALLRVLSQSQVSCLSECGSNNGFRKTEMKENSQFDDSLDQLRGTSECHCSQVCRRHAAFPIHTMLTS